jgi:hypothetical protein
MASGWTPTSGKPVEQGWTPTSGRTSVSAHSRKPRSKATSGHDSRVEDAITELRKTSLMGVPRGTIEAGVDLLPAIGSLAPGPLSPVGAGIGAIARQGASELLGNGPPQPISGALAGVTPGSLMSRALDVVEQASLAKLGTKIGPGIKVRGRTIIPGLEQVGRGVMRATLGLTSPQARTAIKTGFTVAEKKLDAMLSRLGRIGERQMELLAKAPPTAVFQTRDLANYIEDTIIKKMRGSFKHTEDVKKLVAWTEEMYASHPTGQMTAQEVHIAAQLAREEAAPILKKAGEQLQVTMKDPLEQKWFKATTEWAQDQLAGPKNLQGIRTGQGSQLGPVLGGKYARWNHASSRLIDLKNRVLPIVKKQEQGGPLKQLISSVNPYTAGVVAGGMIGGTVGAVSPSASWGQRAMQGLGGAVGGATLGLKAPEIALLMSNPQFARQMAMLQQTIGAAFTAPQGGPPVAP